MNRDVIVAQGEPEVAVEIIANNIVAIADGMKRLRAGRLNDRALFLLIQHASPAAGLKRTKPSIDEIRAVFEGIASLERVWLKKKEAK